MHCLGYPLTILIKVTNRKSKVDKYPLVKSVLYKVMLALNNSRNTLTKIMYYNNSKSML